MRRLKWWGALAGAVLLIGSGTYVYLSKGSGGDDVEGASPCEAKSDSANTNVAVADQGFYQDADDAPVWFGAVIDNNDAAKIAYHVDVTFTVLDENCEPLQERDLNLGGADPALEQTVPVIHSGESAGLGGYVIPHEGRKVGGVSISIDDAQKWIDADSDEEPHVSEMIGLSDITLSVADEEMIATASMRPGRFDGVVGMSMVYRDLNDRIVGGSPVLGGTEFGGDDIRELDTGLNVRSISAPRPLVEDSPSGAANYVVDIVDVSTTEVFSYPEYFDTDQSELIGPDN